MCKSYKLEMFGARNNTFTITACVSTHIRHNSGVNEADTRSSTRHAVCIPRAKETTCGLNKTTRSEKQLKIFGFLGVHWMIWSVTSNWKKKKKKGNTLPFLCICPLQKSPQASLKSIRLTTLAHFSLLKSRAKSPSCQLSTENLLHGSKTIPPLRLQGSKAIDSGLPRSRLTSALRTRGRRMQNTIASVKREHAWTLKDPKKHPEGGARVAVRMEGNVQVVREDSPTASS